MIRAVFFDLYGTLVRFYPPTEEIQTVVCREFGLQVTPRAIIRGYAVADDYMSLENEKQSVFHRSAADRKVFFSEYERRILQSAGIDASNELATQVWERVSRTPKELSLFEDVVPALQGLKAHGLTIGLLSNLNSDMGELTRRLGLKPYLDFWFTGDDVGANKPHPPIFQAALKRAMVMPSQAIHVGDQYHSDVLGALGVGIKPILLDREDLQPQPEACAKIRSLLEVATYI